jgi:hypothetical protein
LLVPDEVREVEEASVKPEASFLNPARIFKYNSIEINGKLIPCKRHDNTMSYIN